MWNCDSLGSHLRKLLLENGNFEAVEHKIRKYATKKSRVARNGGWYSRAVLMTKHCWSKTPGSNLNMLGSRAMLIVHTEAKEDV